MKKLSKSRKIIMAVLSLTLVFVIGLSATMINSTKNSKACLDPDEVVINILHTNDIHADVENIEYIAKYKEETKNALWFDGGDSTQGQPLATYTKGKAVVDILNSAKLDAAAVGNHEFDYGKEQLLANAKMAKFPFLAANVKNEKGQPFLKKWNKNGAYTIIKKAGKKIGVFGITTTETSYKTNPQNVKGITFESEIESAQKTIDILKKAKCDLIVCLAHIGNDEGSKPTSVEFGNALNGCDLIIDGHSHTEIQQKLDNGTVLVQTGTQLKKLGFVSVVFTKDDNKKVVKKIDTKLLSQDEYQIYGKEVKVIRVFNKYTAELEPILGTVVGKTATDLIANEVLEDGSSIRICRQRETSMGDLVSDSNVWYAKNSLQSTEYKNLPVVALQNGGGVRANIKAGNITIGDVYNVLPFGNNISVKIITPDVLYKTLEYSISGLSLDSKGKISGLVGSYPQISGMRFEMNLKNEAYAEGKSAGKRITAIYLVDENGKETKLDRKDNNTQIAFASNNFLIAGGDGFTMLSGLKHILEGNVLDEILADYITELTEKSNGCFTYQMPGNRSVEVNQK